MAEGRPWDPQRGETSRGFTADISDAGGRRKWLRSGLLGWRSAAADLKTPPLSFSLLFIQSDMTGKLLILVNAVLLLSHEILYQHMMLYGLDIQRPVFSLADLLPAK